MRSLVSALLVAASATGLSAQSFGDSRAFGYWSVETSDGISGTLAYGPSICRYELRSAFASYSAFCSPNWDPRTGILMLHGTSGVAVRTVPDYQPERTIETASGTGSPILTFVIDDIGSGRLSGHLLGVGDNVHVTLARH